MALESTAWSARCRAMVQISRSKAKSAFPTHSTWLSIQSTAIIIVALSGERRVGSVSRSIRKSRYRAARHWRGAVEPELIRDLRHEGAHQRGTKERRGTEAPPA